MEYTKDEITMMQNNVRQIEKWIAEEIIPYTREYFEIGWGGKYRDPRSWGDSVDNYHIGVYPNLKVAAIGEKYGPNRTFIMPKDIWNSMVEAQKCPFYSSSSGYGSYCIYSLPYLMNEILSNWQTIKYQMVNKVAEQKRKVQAITSFQL